MAGENAVAASTPTAALSTFAALKARNYCFYWFGLIFYVLQTFWFRFLIDAKLYERRKAGKP